MSYCRFENTLNDLDDCNDALNDMLEAGEGFKGLSDSEKGALERMYNLMEEFRATMDVVADHEEDREWAEQEAREEEGN